ncbi:tensin-1-like [Hetaerina americana]|uniref:tensin-1-like n=1 Tax=Hetaerina americana TaxID=62018 RepID=UPI003A7F472E
MWAVVTTNSASESSDASSPSNPRSQLKVKFATLVDKVSCEEGSGGEEEAAGGGRGAEDAGRGGEEVVAAAAAEEEERPDHSLNDDDYPDLPDGSCFRRGKSVTRWSPGPVPSPGTVDFKGTPAAVLRCAQYMGSFAVAGVDQTSRAEYIRNQLKQMRGPPRTKPVLLVISLAGIKVCSIDGKSVHMAHALRRISYATCDPDHFQFSFLAREPRGHLSLQYCHTFLAQSSQQAEELNSIVGNAFRMAYASQLHRRPAKAPPGAAATTSSGSSSVGSSSPPPPSDVTGPPPTTASLPPPALPPHTVSPRLPPAKMPAPPRAASPAALPPEKRRNQLNQEKHGGGTPLEPSQVLSNDSNNNSNSGNNNSHQLPSLTLHGRSAHRWIATGDVGRALSWVKNNPQVASPSVEMNVQIGGREICDAPASIGQGPAKPNSIPGLKLKSDCPHRVREAAESAPEIEKDNTLHLGMMESSPSSDESNSPTEMNSYKRMTEKPPLIKRLAMMGVGFGPRGDESCPLVRPNTSPTPSPICQPTPTSSSSPGKMPPVSLSQDPQLRGPSRRRPLSGGYVNEAVTSKDGEVNAGSETSNRGVAAKTTSENRNISSKNSKTEPKRFSKEASTAFDTSKSKKMQQGNPSSSLVPCQVSPLSTTISASPMQNMGITAAAAGSANPEAHILGVAPVGGGTDVVSSCMPPPLPERSDSLNDRSAEEGELRAAPWFQAGIPREITLEVLGQEPVGAFMVRESTSKPGCYALSLRVPKDFQQSGIAHYLIMRTNKGYKIKGFTKEFSTLTSLITHHSVMPELLPCPLSLSRYNPSFINSDSSRDFADIDSDPDYNTLADFRKMMADLNV